MSKLKERILFLILGGVLGSILTMAGLMVVVLLLARTPAAISFTGAELYTYKLATTNFFEMAGRWPASETELFSNSMHVVFLALPQPTLDGWGRRIVYEPYSTNLGFGRVLSYGRDGKPGGVGADADIELRFP